jgi:hypothetical protein
MHNLRRLFLDYDAASSWFLRSTNPFWETNKELIRIEVKRLQTLFPKLGKALIMKSNDNGSYHARFPDAKLTKEQEHVLQVESKSHRGYVYFCEEVGDSTLRVSTKNKGKTHEPYLVEIIQPLKVE